MNARNAPTPSLATRTLVQASLLCLLCAAGLLVCNRALAGESELEAPPALTMVVAGPTPEASDPAAAPAAPRVGRLLLAATRLGERVMRLAPWHRQAAMQAVMQPATPPAPTSLIPASLVTASDDGVSGAADTATPARDAWNLKAAPDPLVALIQMSRPTLRLTGGPEISLRVLGGLGVTLRSQF